MSKSLFKTIREMKDDEKKKFFRTLVLSISMVLFISGFGLTLYSCKSEPAGYEAFKAETDWESVLLSGTWMRQSGNIAALEDVQKIRFLSYDGSLWTVRLESSNAQSDECNAAMQKDSGSLNAVSGNYNVHLSEHEGFWLRLTSESGQVADYFLEN